MLKAVMEQRVVPPSRLTPHVPESVDRIVMRALQRDPQRRYATAREMALDLERAVGIASPSEVGDWLQRLMGTASAMCCEKPIVVDVVSR